MVQSKNDRDGVQSNPRGMLPFGMASCCHTLFHIITTLYFFIRSTFKPIHYVLRLYIKIVDVAPTLLSTLIIFMYYQYVSWCCIYIVGVVWRMIEGIFVRGYYPWLCVRSLCVIFSPHVVVFYVYA